MGIRFVVNWKKNDMKYVIFEVSNPTDIKISSSESIWGRRFRYMSHVVEFDKEDEKSKKTFFRNKDRMLYQNLSKF